MATNIEQIFRSFVVNKFKEIQEEKLNSDNAESSQNGELTQGKESTSEDNTVVVQREQSEQSLQNMDRIPSEPLGLEQPHVSAVEDSTSKELKMTEVSSSDEVKKDGSRKKSKKHKKHKSKKKKKKKKKEKNEKRSKSTSSDDDQDDVPLEPKSMWKPAFASPANEGDKGDALSKTEHASEMDNTLSVPSCGIVQEEHEFDKATEPSKIQADSDLGFFGPKCPNEINPLGSANLPTRNETEVQELFSEPVVHVAMQSKTKQLDGSDTKTTTQGAEETIPPSDSSNFVSETHLPQPCLVAKATDSNSNKLESEILDQSSSLSTSNVVQHQPDNSGHRSRSKSASSMIERSAAKSRSRSKSITRKNRSRSKSLVKESSRQRISSKSPVVGSRTRSSPSKQRQRSRSSSRGRKRRSRSSTPRRYSISPIRSWWSKSIRNRQRSRSLSVVRRQRSRTRSAARKRRSKTRSPVRRNRSRSTSASRRRRSRSTSASRRRRSRSRLATRRQRITSRSGSRRRRSKSRSASRRRRSSSRTGSRRRRSRSRSASRRKRSRSRSASRRKRSKSRSVSRRRRSRSRSASRRRRRSRSRSASRRRRSSRSRSASRRRRSSRSRSASRRRRSSRSRSASRRRRSSRSRSASRRRRRSRSRSASRRRRRSRSRSASRRRRLRSTSAIRRRSRSIARTKRSRSVSTDKKRRSKSPTKSRKSRSLSATKRHRLRSGSAARKRRSRSSSAGRKQRSRSRSSARKRRSRSVSRKQKSRSTSSTGGNQSRSVSVTKTRRSKSSSVGKRTSKGGSDDKIGLPSKSPVSNEKSLPCNLTPNQNQQSLCPQPRSPIQDKEQIPLQGTSTMVQPPSDVEKLETNSCAQSPAKRLSETANIFHGTRSPLQELNHTAVQEVPTLLEEDRLSPKTNLGLNEESLQIDKPKEQYPHYSRNSDEPGSCDMDIETTTTEENLDCLIRENTIHSELIEDRPNAADSVQCSEKLHACKSQVTSIELSRYHSETLESLSAGDLCKKELFHPVDVTQEGCYSSVVSDQKLVKDKDVGVTVDHAVSTPLFTQLSTETDGLVGQALIVQSCEMKPKPVEDIEITEPNINLETAADQSLLPPLGCQTHGTFGLKGDKFSSAGIKEAATTTLFEVKSTNSASIPTPELHCTVASKSDIFSLSATECVENKTSMFNSEQEKSEPKVFTTSFADQYIEEAQQIACSSVKIPQASVDTNAGVVRDMQASRVEVVLHTAFHHKEMASSVPVSTELPQTNVVSDSKIYRSVTPDSQKIVVDTASLNRNEEATPKCSGLNEFDVGTAKDDILPCKSLVPRGKDVFKQHSYGEISCISDVKHGPFGEDMKALASGATLQESCTFEEMPSELYKAPNTVKHACQSQTELIKSQKFSPANVNRSELNESNENCVEGQKTDKVGMDVTPDNFGQSKIGQNRSSKDKLISNWTPETFDKISSGPLVVQTESLEAKDTSTKPSAKTALLQREQTPAKQKSHHEFSKEQDLVINTNHSDASQQAEYNENQSAAASVLSGQTSAHNSPDLTSKVKKLSTHGVEDSKHAEGSLHFGNERLQSSVLNKKTSLPSNPETLPLMQEPSPGSTQKDQSLPKLTSQLDLQKSNVSTGQNITLPSLKSVPLNFKFSNTFKPVSITPLHVRSDSSVSSDPVASSKDTSSTSKISSSDLTGAVIHPQKSRIMSVLKPSDSHAIIVPEPLETLKPGSIRVNESIASSETAKLHSSNNTNPLLINSPSVIDPVQSSIHKHQPESLETALLKPSQKVHQSEELPTVSGLDQMEPASLHRPEPSQSETAHKPSFAHLSNATSKTAVKQRHYRSRSKAQESRSPSVDRVRPSRSKSTTRKMRSRSKSLHRKRRSSSARKRRSHSKSTRRRRSRSKSGGKRKRSKSKGRRKHSPSKLAGKRRHTRSKSPEKKKRSKSTERRKMRSKSPIRRSSSRSRSTTRKRWSPSKTGRSKASRSNSPRWRRVSRSKSASSKSRSRSKSASRKYFSKSRLQRRRSRSSTKSVSPRRHSQLRQGRRLSRSPIPWRRTRSRSTRRRTSRSRGRWRRSRSLSTSRNRSRSSSRLSRSLSIKKRHSRSKSPLRRRRSRSQTRQQEKSPCKSNSPPQKKTAQSKSTFKPSIGLKSLIQKQLSQAKLQSSSGKLPSKEQVSEPRLNAKPQSNLSTKTQLPARTQSKSTSGGQLTMPSTQLPMSNITTEAQMPVHEFSTETGTQLSMTELSTGGQWPISEMATGAQWPMSELAAGSQWTMSGLHSGAHWPVSDLSAGAQWPMTDLTGVTQWHMSDLSATSHWAMPDMSAGSQWGVPDMAAGAQWAMHDMAAGSQWTVSNMATEAQWTMPHLTAGTHWNMPTLPTTAQVPVPSLLTEAQVPVSSLADEISVSVTDVNSETSVHVPDLATEAPVHLTDLAPEVPVHVTDLAPEVPVHVTDLAPEVPVHVTDLAPEVPVHVTGLAPEGPVYMTGLAAEVPVYVPDLAAEVPVRVPDLAAEVPVRVPDLAAEVPVRVPDLAAEVPVRVPDLAAEVPVRVPDLAAEVPVRVPDLAAEVPVRVPDLAAEVPVRVPDLAAEVPVRVPDLAAEVPVRVPDLAEEVPVRVPDLAAEVPVRVPDLAAEVPVRVPDLAAEVPVRVPDLAAEVPVRVPDLAAEVPVRVPDLAAEVPVRVPDLAAEVPVRVPDLAAEVPVRVPDLAAEVPVRVPDLAAEVPVRVPDLAAEVPVRVPDLAAEVPVRVPDLAAEVPVRVPDLAAEVPVRVPDLAAEVPVRVPDLAAEVPVRVPDLAAEEPVRVPDLAAEVPVRVPDLAAEVPIHLATEAPVHVPDLAEAPAPMTDLTTETQISDSDIAVEALVPMTNMATKTPVPVPDLVAETSDPVPDLVAEAPVPVPDLVTEAPVPVPDLVTEAPVPVPDLVTEAPVPVPDLVTEAPVPVPDLVTEAPVPVSGPVESSVVNHSQPDQDKIIASTDHILHDKCPSSHLSKKSHGFFEYPLASEPYTSPKQSHLADQLVSVHDDDHNQTEPSPNPHIQQLAEPCPGSPLFTEATARHNEVMLAKTSDNTNVVLAETRDILQDTILVEPTDYSRQPFLSDSSDSDKSSVSTKLLAATDQVVLVEPYLSPDHQLSTEHCGIIDSPAQTRPWKKNTNYLIDPYGSTANPLAEPCNSPGQNILVEPYTSPVQPLLVEPYASPDQSFPSDPYDKSDYSTPPESNSSADRPGLVEPYESPDRPVLVAPYVSPDHSPNAKPHLSNYCPPFLDTYGSSDRSSLLEHYDSYDHSPQMEIYAHPQQTPLLETNANPNGSPIAEPYSGCVLPPANEHSGSSSCSSHCESEVNPNCSLNSETYTSANESLPLDELNTGPNDSLPTKHSTDSSLLTNRSASPVRNVISTESCLSPTHLEAEPCAISSGSLPSTEPTDSPAIPLLAAEPHANIDQSLLAAENYASPSTSVGTADPYTSPVGHIVAAETFIGFSNSQVSKEQKIDCFLKASEPCSSPEDSQLTTEPRPHHSLLAATTCSSLYSHLVAAPLAISHQLIPTPHASPPCPISEYCTSPKPLVDECYASADPPLVNEPCTSLKRDKPRDNLECQLTDEPLAGPDRPLGDKPSASPLLEGPCPNTSSPLVDKPCAGIGHLLDDDLGSSPPISQPTNLQIHKSAVHSALYDKTTSNDASCSSPKYSVLDETCDTNDSQENIVLCNSHPTLPSKPDQSSTSLLLERDSLEMDLSQSEKAGQPESENLPSSAEQPLLEKTNVGSSSTPLNERSTSTAFSQMSETVVAFCATQESTKPLCASAGGVLTLPSVSMLSGELTHSGGDHFQGVPETDQHHKTLPPDLMPYDSEQPVLSSSVCEPLSEQVLLNSQPPPELLPYDTEQPANTYLSLSDYSSEQATLVFQTPPELLPYDSEQPTLLDTTNVQHSTKEISASKLSDGNCEAESSGRGMSPESKFPALNHPSVSSCPDSLKQAPEKIQLDKEHLSVADLPMTDVQLESNTLSKFPNGTTCEKLGAVIETSNLPNYTSSDTILSPREKQDSVPVQPAEQAQLPAEERTERLLYCQITPDEKAVSLSTKTGVILRPAEIYFKVPSSEAITAERSTSEEQPVMLGFSEQSTERLCDNELVPNLEKQSLPLSISQEPTVSPLESSKRQTPSKSITKQSSSTSRSRRSRSRSLGRKKRSRSEDKRSRSRSTTRRKRSRSKSVVRRRRRTRSKSATKSKRSRSKSTTRRKSRTKSPTRRRSRSKATARKRHSRSTSLARGRRSYSASPTRRRRSRSASPARRRRSRSASPARRRRSRSASPARRRRSRSASPARRRRSRSASPARRRRSRSASPARRRRSRSASPARRRRSRSASPARRRRSRSASPARRRRSRSGSPARRRRSRSASPIHRRRSRSASPIRKRKTNSKSPIPKSPTEKQRAGSKSDRSRSPSQSNATRKRKTRSRSTSKDKNKSGDKRRKRSTSKDHYSNKSRRRSRTPPRRKKSRSPVRRAGVCLSPIRRRRSRSPIRRKSFSRSPTRRKRSRSREKSLELCRSPKRLTDLDKAQLLEIAKANAAAMCAKAGVPLPPSLKPAITPVASADEKITHRTYGVTIQELTEKCKQIAQSKEDDVIVNKPHDSDDEEEERPFYNHPFKVNEHKPISFSLLNPTIKPAPKNPVTLTKEFPVSSGSQHRKKESDKVYGEWVPVDKKTEESKDDVFTNAGPSEPIDITAAMNERAIAQTRLNGNPFDLEALFMLNRAQEQIDAWAQSTSLPGQFTGSTGAQVLSADEISNSGPQAWLKKDQFLRAAPVSGGRGALLMRKMGWREGEGLGRHNEGNVNPILIDFKTDRKGLVADGEKAPNKLALPAMKDLSGKHPISVLMELCNKKKWSPPEFVLIDDAGPEHRKRFLFRVTVNGTVHQPSQPSVNKKLAKATAAAAALQGLGALSKESMTPTTSFRSASDSTS